MTSPVCQVFRHPWSKSPSHHEILPAPWYLKVHEPRVSRVSDDSTDGRYSVTNNERLLSYCLMLQKSKKTTTWHVWNSGKNMEYLPYQLVYHSEIVINNMKISCIQGACFEQKILKNAILPSVHLSPCFEHVLSTLKIVVFFPHRAATFLSAKSAKTEIESKPTCHVVDMYYSPQKKRYQGCFWVTSKTKISTVVGWTNPFEKYAQVKMGSSSPKRGENKKYFKPPAKWVDNTFNGVLAVISLSQLDTESEKNPGQKKKGLHGRNPGSMLTYGRRLGYLGLLSNYRSYSPNLWCATGRKPKMRQTCHVYPSNNVKSHLVGGWTNPFEKAKVKLDSFPPGITQEFSKKYVSCQLPPSENFLLKNMGEDFPSINHPTHFPSPQQPRLNFTEPEPPSTNSCLLQTAHHFFC